ncbi:SAM-dependent methyltransferase [Streptomyces sp. NPDC058653]|uniref:SAM-dependent methyltransferase n=1 Tax=Streptomyces sp. NPDC058653 TaxID=3346576 RepID=UPI003651DF07
MTGHDAIDTSRPHPARMYDWFLGGKDNYPVDEEMARQLLALNPLGREMAKCNRAFMHRATRWLGAEAGVRQYLDIGTGIPTEPNLHQIAQEVAADSRVVYTDNDPIVLRHAEALLRSSAEGLTEYVQADAREPDEIVEQAGRILDFKKPVALSLIALLHFVPDEDGAHELVHKLLEPLPSGSYLVISHTTGDFDPDNVEKAKELYRAKGVPLALRSRDEVAQFFDGLEMVEPGVSLVADWRPELGDVVPVPDDAVIAGYVGVARKP